MMKIAACALMMALFVPGAALAEPKASEPADADGLNRVVCRTEDMTGSRLSKRKRCMTGREWAEARDLDRQSLERTQQQRYPGNEYGGGPLQGNSGRSN